MSTPFEKMGFDKDLVEIMRSRVCTRDNSQMRVPDFAFAGNPKGHTYMGRFASSLGPVRDYRRMTYRQVEDMRVISINSSIRWFVAMVFGLYYYGCALPCGRNVLRRIYNTHDLYSHEMESYLRRMSEHWSVILEAQPMLRLRHMLHRMFFQPSRVGGGFLTFTRSNGEEASFPPVVAHKILHLVGECVSYSCWDCLREEHARQKELFASYPVYDGWTEVDVSVPSPHMGGREPASYWGGGQVCEDGWNK